MHQGLVRTEVFEMQFLPERFADLFRQDFLANPRDFHAGHLQPNCPDSDDQTHNADKNDQDGDAHTVF